MEWNNVNLIKILKTGGVVVMPTDTIYGIVGSAFNLSAINRIYSARKRAPERPCIILIGDIGDLQKFSISLSEEQENKIVELWKEEKPISIILDCPVDSFKELHRGTNTLAFRLPMQENLQNLLKKVGPLIAPSANPEGLSPAKNIEEAKNYFGSSVDLYLDGGEIFGKPSQVIKLNIDGSIDILRP